MGTRGRDAQEGDAGEGKDAGGLRGGEGGWAADSSVRVCVCARPCARPRCLCIWVRASVRASERVFVRARARALASEGHAHPYPLASASPPPPASAWRGCSPSARLQARVGPQPGRAPAFLQKNSMRACMHTDEAVCRHLSCPPGSPDRALPAPPGRMTQRQALGVPARIVPSGLHLARGVCVLL